MGDRALNNVVVLAALLCEVHGDVGACGPHTQQLRAREVERAVAEHRGNALAPVKGRSVQCKYNKMARVSSR